MRHCWNKSCTGSCSKSCSGLLQKKDSHVWMPHIPARNAKSLKITKSSATSSREFFAAVAEHLKPEGVMVVNLNMTSREDGSINQYLCDTMASVFAYTYLADVPGNTNTEVFCTNAPGLPERFAASRAALTDGDYAAMMAEVAADLTVYTGGDCLLTDDRAPVEVLGMRVLDELIAGELDYYRENFSLQEILGMLG